jgi:hypothetical protein
MAFGPSGEFQSGTNPSTGGGGGSGTVTSVSVVGANGLAGTVANPTTTPAITLLTSVTGILKGNGTTISAAVGGTDYIPGPTATVIPANSWPAVNGTGSGNLTAQTGSGDTVGYNLTDLGTGGIALTTNHFGGAGIELTDTGGGIGITSDTEVTVSTSGAGQVALEAFGTGRVLIETTGGGATTGIALTTQATDTGGITLANVGGQVKLPNLPTSDPSVAHAIWDDNGTVVLSGHTAGGAGATVVRAFPFAFDAAGLATGLALYTPTAGDKLLDAWLEIDTVWNGTTPLADVGVLSGGTGWLKYQLLDMTTPKGLAPVKSTSPELLWVTSVFPSGFGNDIVFQMADILHAGASNAALLFGGAEPSTVIAPGGNVIDLTSITFKPEWNDGSVSFVAPPGQIFLTIWNVGGTNSGAFTAFNTNPVTVTADNITGINIAAVDWTVNPSADLTLSGNHIVSAAGGVFDIGLRVSGSRVKTTSVSTDSPAGLPLTLTADPVSVVVSTSGNTGGGDPGASQGSATLYLVTATPI